MDSRRKFLKTVAGSAAGALASQSGFAQTSKINEARPEHATGGRAEYTLHIAETSIEIASKKNISTVTYNGKFPGPLLRLKEGQQVTVDVFNETSTPEQLHWHGQFVPTSIDGAAEEGTPFVPARGKRRLVFTPRPAGFRFYHTHNRAGSNLSAGQYSGQVGRFTLTQNKSPADTTGKSSWY